MTDVSMPDTYKAMCRQCGEIVKHTLDRSEAIPCGNGHSVAPTIARAALIMRKQEGGSTSSRTYTPPPRYEVRAHNAKYQARRRKRKAAGPQPDAPELDPHHDDL